MRSLCLAFLSVFLFTACETTDHEGFKRIDRSIHLKLQTLGDDARSVGPDRYISLAVELRQPEGEQIALKRVERVRLQDAQWPEPITSILREHAEGDELLIRGRLDELALRPWFDPMELGADEEILELEIGITEVLTEDELRQVRAEQRLADDHELEGLHCMEGAKDSIGFTDADLQDGIFFRMIKEGSGGRPVSGKLARVHYKTYLCDGRMIDDTYRAEVLEYPIGKPDQVLPGFAVAVSKMRAGGQALFLIPPALAFGDRGSSSGLVPPHTALIYEATLLEVR